MSATKLTALALVAVLAAPGSLQAQQSFSRGNPLSSIFRCDAEGNKQGTGAVIGGVVGGAVGNQLSKKDRALGTVLGAALGAAAGSYVGCRMQASDQQKAQQAAEDALNRGGSQSWSNPDTGASGNVQVVSNPNLPQAVNLAGLRLASGVTLVNGYDGASGRYRARNVANLRGAPSTASAVLGKLRKGETIDAIARVSGTNWLLVGNGGVGRGYVSEAVVSMVGATTYAQSSGPSCKTFDQTLATRDGAPETRRYTACQDNAGQWVVQS